MISGLAVNQVYLATGFTDMRKSINGLSLMVSEQLAHDPFSGSVFVFCNRTRDKLKQESITMINIFRMETALDDVFDM